MKPLERPLVLALEGLRKLAKLSPKASAYVYDLINRQTFTDLSWHERMLADRIRVEAYRRGIAGSIKPGDVVIDLGTGTGILAFMASRAGAKHIYAIDHSDFIDVAREIAAAGPAAIRDLTGPDLRNAILALAAADAAVSNDSGLLHVAAALGTPAVGIFGPTSPWHWAPLNPIAAVIETGERLPCRPCHKPVCRLRHHRCMRDIAVATVAAATRSAFDRTGMGRLS